MWISADVLANLRYIYVEILRLHGEDGSENNFEQTTPNSVCAVPLRFTHMLTHIAYQQTLSKINFFLRPS